MAYYTWALDFGFWIFLFLISYIYIYILDSADAPSCYQKGSVFDLALSYSDAL